MHWFRSVCSPIFIQVQGDVSVCFVHSSIHSQHLKMQGCSIRASKEILGLFLHWNQNAALEQPHHLIPQEEKSECLRAQ